LGIKLDHGTRELKVEIIFWINGIESLNIELFGDGLEGSRSAFGGIIPTLERNEQYSPSQHLTP
jgi:hypothetical protein